MSEMAAYITGVELRVDGGMHFGNGGFLFKPEGQAESRVFNGFHRDETAKLLK